MCGSIDPIVRGFFSHDDIVDMTFLQTGRGNPDEARSCAKFSEVRRTAIPHAGTKPAIKLMQAGRKPAAIRNPTFNAFRNKLALLHIRLEIAVCTPLSHCPKRTHAAVDLIGTTLEENDFAGRFVRTGEQRSNHHS
jgi:hypothetical protein